MELVEQGDEWRAGVLRVDLDREDLTYVLDALRVAAEVRYSEAEERHRIQGEDLSAPTQRTLDELAENHDYRRRWLKAYIPFGVSDDPSAAWRLAESAANPEPEVEPPQEAGVTTAETPGWTQNSAQASS